MDFISVFIAENNKRRYTGCPEIGGKATHGHVSECVNMGFPGKLLVDIQHHIKDCV